MCSYNDFKQNIEDLKTKTLEVISPEVKAMRSMYQYYIIQLIETIGIDI